MEEGTLSEWRYEMLSPHAQNVVVAAVRESWGPKDNRRDAFGLAEGLRLGVIKRKVYKERGGFGALGYRAKGYRWASGDVVRVKDRLKSLYRSRGVPVAGPSVYAASKRGKFLGRLPRPAKPLAELLYEELDALEALKSQAKKAMLAEAQRHLEFRLVKSCPGLGPVRTAELLPIVVTPYRFQSKRGFWSYCGLGIVTRSSSDWVRTRTDEWVKAEVKRTRGLTRNLNHTLKAIFKEAATPVIGRAEDEPIYRHCLGLLDGGTKPNLAKLTIARQIASAVLAVWRTKEVYDSKRLESASKSGPRSVRWRGRMTACDRSLRIAERFRGAPPLEFRSGPPGPSPPG
ncbi:MAG: transposase [Gemmatimonadota bacterium]